MSITCVMLDNIPYPTESFASLRSPQSPTKIYKNSVMFSHYGIFIIFVEVGGSVTKLSRRRLLENVLRPPFSFDESQEVGFLLFLH